MDQLTRHLLDKEVKKFIDSIEPSLVCKLASSLHPEKKSCQVFSDPQKGSYNICFPVVFTDAGDQIPNVESTQSAERWMIRIPLLPRLAFPEEKMRGEIATMKYIAEKTTIPVPRLFEYSINRDNVLNLPFMALEYITGKALHGTDVPCLPDELKSHLFDQLADVYIQLYRQQFDHVGALTLDSNDENWVFEHNRPLTIELNDQELSGMKSSEIIPAHQTYNSTIDYAYAVLKLIFNDFYRGKDSVFDKKDARNYLYGIFASQGIVMEWVDPKDNHGPFILMHGDLRPPNIFVDADLNIISVIDWEWSHTVPPQMFVPPSWITGQELPAATKKPYDFAFTVYISQFQRAAKEREDKHYNPDNKLKFILPLVKLWSKHLMSDTVFIAYALLKSCYFGNVYWNLLDDMYYGEDSDKRVEGFFKLCLRKQQEEELQRVLSDLEAFQKELALAGLDPIEPLKPPTLDPAKGKEGAAIHQVWRKPNLERIVALFCRWLPCSLVGVSVFVCCIIAKRR
ncbi:uncharacterized protein CIMG_00067 [Coccidioides immitis RS]|uniref:Aminoglycoside phosphotransferase domain-containing protein n=1 Tax=Coccidioides immitis (strain RS) TaxID=246410 RepID=J3KG73_COCIM|nr:uncharacterized protein CIMG_00067 [Coccidioides immitis RS]EAS34713.3 hypothetical protein CIMG_00067 [Coccidioides immitis RS]